MSIEAGTQEDSTIGVIPVAPWRVKAISVLPGYRLSGVREEPSYGVFAAIANPRFFEQVRVELGVVT